MRTNMIWTRALIHEHAKNSFFSIDYIKADGSSRKVVCRLGVKRYLRVIKKGEDRRIPSSTVITVYDMVKKNYRSLRLNRIQSITVSGETIT